MTQACPDRKKISSCLVHLGFFCGLPNRGLWKLSILNVKEGVEHTLVLIKVMIKTIIKLQELCTKMLIPLLLMTSFSIYGRYKKRYYVYFVYLLWRCMWSHFH